MPEQLLFAAEVAINGLMAGVMYALVALGFVLIFKASGIFNYAQGIMALFAALTLVGIQQGQIPFAHLINTVFDQNYHHFDQSLPGLITRFFSWLSETVFGVEFSERIRSWMINGIAIFFTLIVMVLFAWLVNHLILRHLVNQDPIILFMATIGLFFFVEGFGGLMWGADMKRLDVGLPQGLNETVLDTTESLFGYGFFIDNLDIVATIIASILVLALALYSQYSRDGRALRAVADDHQAALSVGISLRYIWVLVWSIAGFVALVAGVMWGTKSGVQLPLALIALKALPVLMLGGFTSIPGAIVGGLIIGMGEKLFEFFVGPHVGGAVESWFAYMLALLFLVFRPQGLFGEKIIERV